MLTLFLGYPSQALAQSQNSFQIVLEQIRSLFVPRDKTKKGTPTGRVRGGAGRGQCPVLASNDQTPLTALVPIISNSLDKEALLSKPESAEIVWGQTIEAYPTFWFYIPYEYEESQLEYAKFVLLDEEKHIVIGPILLKLPEKGQPSLVKFTLPKQKPLEVDQQYNWYFSIICDERKPSRNPSVTGWIQRISLPIFPSNNYLYYAKQGIWYDTVTRLADSRAAISQAEFDILPAAGEKSLTTQMNEIEENWLEVFRFLIQSNQKSAKKIDEKQINRIANSPIIELLPDSESEI